MKKKILFIILVAISIFMCFPVIFLLAGSFMGADELNTYLAPVLAEKSKGYVSWGLLPSYPTLRAYVELLFDTPEFFVMFWNSVKIVFLSVGGQLIVGIPAAWGFARYKFPFKKVLFTIYIVVMLMPFQVTMLSSYLVLDKLHLLNTHGSIILPAIFSTFSVFIMYRFFCNIPESIIESARIDGCSVFMTYFKIVMPLLKPAMATLIIMQAFQIWNDYLLASLYVSDKKLKTLTVAIQSLFSAQTSDYLTAIAAIVISVLPIAILFISLQKYFIKGMTVGAVKG